MEIEILCENTSSDVGYLAEWGFSAYIRFEGTNILFDTGYSDAYVQNAKKKGIDLEDVNIIVLSHYHSDHCRGLQFHSYQSRKQLLCHPEVLEKLPKEQAQALQKSFNLQTSKDPLEFVSDVFYLGEVPREMSFEKGAFKDDKMRDDSALAIKMDKGVLVISGCSHAGICNICEYAKQVTGLPLYGVIGGFHLFEEDKIAVEGALSYFHKEQPKHLYPMHCMDFPTLSKFFQHFPIKKYSSGDVIHLN